MSGLYFALSIAGIFIIIRWFIRNDGRSQTSGLLAMKANEARPDANRPDR